MNERSATDMLSSIDALMVRAQEDLTKAKWALVHAKLAAIHEARRTKGNVPRKNQLRSNTK